MPKGRHRLRQGRQDRCWGPRPPASSKTANHNMLAVLLNVAALPGFGWIGRPDLTDPPSFDNQKTLSKLSKLSKLGARVCTGARWLAAARCWCIKDANLLGILGTLGILELAVRSRASGWSDGGMLGAGAGQLRSIDKPAQFRQQQNLVKTVKIDKTGRARRTVVGSAGRQVDRAPFPEDLEIKNENMKAYLGGRGAGPVAAGAAGRGRRGPGHRAVFHQRRHRACDCHLHPGAEHCRALGHEPRGQPDLSSLSGAPSGSGCGPWSRGRGGAGRAMGRRWGA